MLQCSQCEHCVRGPGERITFSCDPFTNIKEPECLVKWQLLRMTEQGEKLDRLVAAYEATVAMYRKLAPLQEKMFRHMEREIDDLDESESWKYGEEPPEAEDADDDEADVDDQEHP